MFRWEQQPKWDLLEMALAGFEMGCGQSKVPPR